MAEVIDVALRTSPRTRAAWEAACAAAARHASRKGAYAPSIDLGAGVTWQESFTSPGRSQSESRDYDADISARWLLFDFGGREASISESRQALVAANWNHNQSIQDVILGVQEAGFRYVAIRAMRGAEESSIREARASLDAAEARHRGGLATIADVLQARTALSQAQLSLDGLEGDLLASRGALAVAMGLPASFEFDLAEPSTPARVESLTAEVEIFMERARRDRPDLAAARAEAEASRARFTATRAEGYPSFSAGGTVGRRWFETFDTHQDRYSASIEMTIPLFTGLSHRNDVRAAAADIRAAEDRLRSAELDVGLEVWSGYFDWKTAVQRLGTSGELLASATESHRVAAGRYQQGVGDILELLAAQAALESARAIRVQAWTDWYLAMARLAHATGALTPPVATDSAIPGAPGKDNPR